MGLTISTSSGRRRPAKRIYRHLTCLQMARIMFRINRPSPDAVRRFLDEQSCGAFSYPFVGATAGEPPPGYTVDHTRIELGTGKPAFEAGVAALRQWAQFRQNWVEPWPADAPIQVGEVVAIIVRVPLCWWLNACRIVYIIDDQDSLRQRFGFAYGTLPDHAARGEERFLVFWNRADDSVWFEILAFSRPRHLLARLGYFLFRHFQTRFARDATAALRAVVERVPNVILREVGNGHGRE
jgi:uncharacterized protein (UPF0548 family)